MRDAANAHGNQSMHELLFPSEQIWQCSFLVGRSIRASAGLGSRPSTVY